MKEKSVLGTVPVIRTVGVIRTGRGNSDGFLKISIVRVCPTPLYVSKSSLDLNLYNKTGAELFSEFEYWKKMMAQYNMSLPTYGQLQDKEKKIDQAKQHVITDAEIADMVKEKAKYRSAPVNFATKKTTLLKLRDAAETEGNLDKVFNLSSFVTIQFYVG